MKKLLFIALFAAAFLSVFVSCASTSLDYPQPDFEKPLSYVIDTGEISGRMEDYVKLHNKSSDSNISFNVYVHDPDSQEWIFFGKAALKDAGDTDTIDTDIDDIDDYRYFAVESLNGKEYTYEVYKRRNDLNIDVLD